MGYVFENYVWISNIEKTNKYTLSNNDIYKYRMVLMGRDKDRSND